MTTVRNQLMKLKPAHRDAALTNMKPSGMTEGSSCIATAIGLAFDWASTPEGYDFWRDIRQQLIRGDYTFTEGESKERESPLPTDAAERKTYPIFSGCINYFPNAIAAVSHLSYKGSQQHHPDQPLHWDKDKSSDELDALMRHMIEGDWEQVAWRALANLERKLTGHCQYEKAIDKSTNK